MNLRFKPEKAVNQLLYVASKVLAAGQLPDIHRLFKVIYLADKMSLEEEARFISDDKYIAMEYGPVPSAMYDIVKWVRRTSTWMPDEYIPYVNQKFNLFGDSLEVLFPLVPANLEVFSDSDIEFMDKAYSEWGQLEFNKRTDISHDENYKETVAKKGLNKEIDCNLILRNIGDESLIELITQGYPGKEEPLAV